MRVALVHDWLTGMRGGEWCLEALLDLYPEAEIFTLLHMPGSVSAKIEARPIHTSFVNRLPRARGWYRYFLPLFPAAIERLDLGGFDLVISTSHCVAKSVVPAPGAKHLCYCLTPMRYIWDLYDEYFGRDRANAVVRTVMPVLAKRLRRWDVNTADRVDAYVACSRHIAERIERIYRRRATVVYPPVAVERFHARTLREDFYLTVSALVPYKRVDLAVTAFNRLGKRLIVVGEGSEYRRLLAAAGPTVTMMGRVDLPALLELYATCRAFVFCANEDFGIAPVEAQAAGAPVIGYVVGGLAETVVDYDGAAVNGARATGILYGEQTPDALVEAVLRFEQLEFDPPAIRENAARFTAEAFKTGIQDRVRAMMTPPARPRRAGRTTGSAVVSCPLGQG